MGSVTLSNEQGESLTISSASLNDVITCALNRARDTQTTELSNPISLFVSEGCSHGQIDEAIEQLSERLHFHRDRIDLIKDLLHMTINKEGRLDE